MIVADAGTCLEVSGSGEVLEPSDGVHGAAPATGAPLPAMRAVRLVQMRASSRPQRWRALWLPSSLFTARVRVAGGPPLPPPAAIGSGARFAIAAARALVDQPQLSALDVAQRAMRIAADKCIYVSAA